jgi:hypothetical protein
MKSMKISLQTLRVNEVPRLQSTDVAVAHGVNYAIYYLSRTENPPERVYKAPRVCARHSRLRRETRLQDWLPRIAPLH